MTTRLSTPTSTSPRRSGARTRAAVALAAGVVLSAGLAGCGSDGGDDTASDPDTSSSTPSPSQDTTSDTPTPDPGTPSSGTIPATGSAGVTEATLLSATEAGGSASTLAVALDTEQARADFAAQFEGAFGETVSAEAARAAQEAPGSTPYGATVAIGCDPPLGVAVEAGEAGFEVVPQLPKKGVQCLAPVTFVVVFSVPDA